MSVFSPPKPRTPQQTNQPTRVATEPEPNAGAAAQSFVEEAGTALKKKANTKKSRVTGGSGPNA